MKQIHCHARRLALCFKLSKCQLKDSPRYQAKRMIRERSPYTSKCGSVRYSQKPAGNTDITAPTQLASPGRNRHADQLGNTQRHFLKERWFVLWPVATTVNGDSKHLNLCRVVSLCGWRAALYVRREAVLLVAVIYCSIFLKEALICTNRPLFTLMNWTGNGRSLAETDN